MTTRFEKQYCLDCMCEHWVEVIRKSTGWEEICHGEEFKPADSATHYTQWRAGGIELVEKAITSNIKLPIDWQMAEELENDFVPMSELSTEQLEEISSIFEVLPKVESEQPHV